MSAAAIAHRCSAARLSQLQSMYVCVDVRSSQELISIAGEGGVVAQVSMKNQGFCTVVFFEWSEI